MANEPKLVKVVADESFVIVRASDVVLVATSIEEACCA